MSSLQRLLKTARKASYYREVIPEDAAESGALGSVPITTQGQYKKISATNPMLLQAEVQPGGIVLQTGGTTGSPKYAIYSGVEMRRMVRAGVTMLRTMGVKSGDHVLNCLAAGELYGGLITLEHELLAANARSLPVGAQVPPEFFALVARQFKPQAMFIQPMAFIPTLRKAHEMAPELEIPLVLYGGTGLTREDAGWLREAFGVQRFSSVIASVDALMYGVQCEHCKGTVHHAMDDFNHVEIVDADGGPVGPGEAGRIILTSLYRTSFPLVRYDIGDLGRWVEGPCACGRKGRRFEFVGRGGDYMKIAPSVYVWFHELCEPLYAEGASVVQAILEPEGHITHMVLNVEAERTEPSRAMDALYTRFPAIKSHVETGMLRVTFAPKKPGEIPRSQRTGKLPNVIDHRTAKAGV
ncbi:phenylacetate--CoA ligase family protein [Archangium sp.]|uniref:phenylacetate--CoA ligase family protein n=1 Tax=Archangium sp. TaxID=1872627 RepID=UPI002D4063C4|nr:AMP-binding protein [Archangium sp.]HYO56257.1 AMP-binding protein [Archangium sp.]